MISRGPFSWHRIALATGAMAAGLAALGGGGGCSSDDTSTAGAGGVARVNVDRFDVAIDGATEEQHKAFREGDVLFDLALRPADGLGPLYTRPSCGACHEQGLRGPGLVEKVVVVSADGVTPDADQSALPYGNTVHPLVAGGATTPVVPPEAANVRRTTRLGPPILGHGYMEAILDTEIERVAAEQAKRTDGIHGRVNHVVYQSEPNPDQTFNTHQKGDAVIGRFGLKARIATLDEFTADALQGDMGITSPLRLTEIKNPDGLTDDAKPGVDVTADSVNKRATYVRLTAIPVRVSLSGEGAKLFERVDCNVCHLPTLATRPDYPIAQLAGIDAAVYTDMLLHDMGDELADGQVEGEAGPRDWRTAPLIGLRFNQTFLHDGRAVTLDEAILKHAGNGSEANGSVAAYEALSAADRAALLAFVGAL